MAKRKAAPDAPAEPQPAAPAEPPPGDYTVLARRYRPQRFADLVGQEPVAQALANALQSGRVAHAYLFTGARGVGKTSTARILAKALNCVTGPTTTPCGECDLCRAIAAGEDTDVLEIDGASNRGIDEVREIRQNVQYRPSRGRYKIYIIDEVHMLTTPAFNALLKTLEEPPPHVKFIFATTEANKIPVTILSRCQRFDFGGISLPRIVDRLKAIVRAEGMQADDDALELIARRAGGSMRDAQSLLDQLLAFGGDRLTAANVHGLLGTADEERVAALAAAVLGRDPKRALALLEETANQGQQLGELLDQLLDYWRDLMVVNAAGADGQSVSVTGEARKALQQQAQALKLDTILAGLDILVTAKSRLRTTSHVRVLLEMALVRLSQLEDLVPLSQVAQWLQQGGTAPAGVTPRPNNSAAGGNSRVIQLPGPAAGEKKKPADDSVTSSETGTLPLTDEAWREIWPKLLVEVGFVIAADLRKSLSQAIPGPNTLVLRYPESYNGLGMTALEPTRHAKVEEVLSRLTGQPCTVRLELIRDTDAAPAGNRPTVAASVAQTRQLRAELAQLPLVKRAREALGAEIVRADDGFGTAAQPPTIEPEGDDEGD